MPLPSDRLGRAVKILPLMPAVFLWAAVVEVGLHRTTLVRLCRFMGVRLLLEAPEPTSRHAEVHDVSSRDQTRLRAVRVLYRHWPAARERQCLRYALVAGRLLRRSDPCLRIGVNRVNGHFLAHAWLVLPGDLQLDSAAALYLPLVTSPA